MPTSEGARFTMYLAVRDKRASISLVEQRFSDAQRCLAATVSAVRISSGPPEDNGGNPKHCLGFPHICTPPGDGLQPHSEANPRYARLRGCSMVYGRGELRTVALGDCAGFTAGVLPVGVTAAAAALMLGDGDTRRRGLQRERSFAMFTVRSRPSRSVPLSAEIAVLAPS